MYFEDNVKTILPRVDAQRATKMNNGKDGMEYEKEINESTAHVGGPKIGIRFKRKTTANV